VIAQVAIRSTASIGSVRYQSSLLASDTLLVHVYTDRSSLYNQLPSLLNNLSPDYDVVHGARRALCHRGTRARCWRERVNERMSVWWSVTDRIALISTLNNQALSPVILDISGTLMWRKLWRRVLQC